MSRTSSKSPARVALGAIEVDVSQASLTPRQQFPGNVTPRQPPSSGNVSPRVAPPSGNGTPRQPPSSGNVTPRQAPPSGNVTPRRPSSGAAQHFGQAGLVRQPSKPPTELLDVGGHTPPQFAQEVLHKRIDELERIMSMQPSPMELMEVTMFQKKQEERVRYLEAKFNDRFLDIEKQIRAVQMEVVEKTERTSRAVLDAIDRMDEKMNDLQAQKSKEVVDAIDLMETSMRDLRSELQDLSSSLGSSEKPQNSQMALQAVVNRTIADSMASIEKKFDGMSLVQTELVQLSERCNDETQKLAKNVEQMGAAVASVQTRVAEHDSGLVHTQESIQRLVKYVQTVERLCQVSSGPQGASFQQVASNDQEKASL